MVRAAVVGCTGKLGKMIIKDALLRTDIEVCYAIARKGNPHVGNNMYELIGKSGDLVIVDDIEKINLLSTIVPVFMTGNFSIALHNFIETLIFAVKRISIDTDVQVVEYHHNEKQDVPSGTAIMIRDALIKANPRFRKEDINICSVRGGNIFGEHEVIFANCKDEVVTYKHSVSSREAFAEGAIEVLIWLVTQTNGLYNMDDFCTLSANL